MRQAIGSMLHLFAVFAFFAAGGVAFALPYLPETRLRLSSLLLDRPEIFSSIAFGFFLAALLLLAGFYGLSRGRVLRIRMGKHLAEVDAVLIRQTLDLFFRQEFPQKISLSEVEIVRAKKLEIGVRLSSKSELDEELLQSAEKALASLLRERFGYVKPFDLIVKI
jgi:hypothetical protein